MTNSTATDLIPAIPLGELLADADARTRQPGLAGIAALAPAPITVSVGIGRATHLLPTDPPVDYWPIEDSGAHAYEAYYDPQRVSLADATTHLRARLAEHGCQVAEFIDEDAEERSRRERIAYEAIGEWEDFRQKMRSIGQSSPAVEQFCDEMVALLAVSEDPQAALNAVFQMLADRKASA